MDEVYKASVVVDVVDRTEPELSNIQRRVSAFEARTARIAKRMQSMSRGLTSVGRTLTRWVTLPIVGAGAAALKLYGDFEQSFTRIRALVGASGRQIAGYQKTVLDMARRTGRAPQELAEALYFVTSSGFEGKKALEVLEASAKASASGLGDTAVVADAVTSAVNAYGQANLKASRATDILLATVREGKAEPEQLAASIGRVISPAQTMGVEFWEVGAALAGLSLNGLDAAEAVTALRGVIMTVMNPSKQGRDALKEIGLTADELQLMMEKDFMGTMVHLRKEFGYTADEAEALAKKPLGDLKVALGEDRTAIGDLFGNVRALNGFLSLTGANVTKNKDIFEELEVAVGDTGVAFEKTQKDPMFKFNKALANLKATAIELAPKILPMAEKLLRLVTGWARAIGNIEPDKIERVVKIAAGLAIAGPAMRLGGGLMGLGARGVGAFGRAGAFATGARGSAAMMGGAGGVGAMQNAAMMGGMAGMWSNPKMMRGGIPWTAVPNDKIARQTYGALGDTLGRARGQARPSFGSQLRRAGGRGAQGLMIAAALAPFAAMGARKLGTNEAAADENDMWSRIRGKGGRMAGRFVATNNSSAILEKYGRHMSALAEAEDDVIKREKILDEFRRTTESALDRATLKIIEVKNQIRDEGGELTKTEQKWLDQALAANEFGLANEIVQKALARTNKEAKAGHNVLARSEDYWKGIRTYMEAIDGKSVRTKIDLVATYGTLREAARVLGAASARYEGLADYYGGPDMPYDPTAGGGGKGGGRGGGRGGGKGGGGGGNPDPGPPVPGATRTMTSAPLVGAGAVQITLTTDDPAKLREALEGAADTLAERLAEHFANSDGDEDDD